MLKYLKEKNKSKKDLFLSSHQILFSFVETHQRAIAEGLGGRIHFRISLPHEVCEVQEGSIATGALQYHSEIWVPV